MARKQRKKTKTKNGAHHNVYPLASSLLLPLYYTIKESMEAWLQNFFFNEFLKKMVYAGKTIDFFFKFDIKKITMHRFFFFSWKIAINYEINTESKI